MEPLGDWLRLCPWRNRLVLILRVTAGGIVTQAANLTDKRRMLMTVTPPLDGELLIVVWPGGFSSSARLIGPDDVAKVLDAVS